MREILFKAKRLDDGEWVEGFYYKMNETTYAFAYDYEKNPVPTHHYIIFERMTDWGLPNQMYRVEVDPETVCQHTGLTDKDGRKIFEGDICKFSVFDYNGHDTQYKGVVVYSGSRFMLWQSKESEYYGNDGGFNMDWVISQDDEFEVIGNIFDNPELLEGKDKQ